MSTRTPPARGRALIGLACALALSGAHAQSEADALSEGLIRLRAEVEQLNSELGLMREEQRVAMNALSAQKAELEASLARQDLATRELRGKLEAQQAAAGADSDDAQLRAVLLDALAALEAQVRAGLPYRVDERVAGLQEFRQQLQDGSLPTARAVNRLWAFHEDEFRLTRENTLSSQTIRLGEDAVLADVAKLGSMALYARTQDGRYGHAVRQADGWGWALLTEADDVRRVAALFDALRKQIRQGYFELPMASTGGAR